MVDKDTPEIPEYQESMQEATGGSNSETILTSSSTLLGNAIIESTTTPINDHDHADERSIFERIGDGGHLYDLRQGWKKTQMLQMLFRGLQHYLSFFCEEAVSSYLMPLALAFGWRVGY